MVLDATVLPQGLKGAYIIGYYIVKKVWDFIDKPIGSYNQQSLQALGKKVTDGVKSHFEAEMATQSRKHIIIEGDPGRGGLFEQAIKIGSITQKGRYIMDENYYSLGYRGDLLRAGTAHVLNYVEIERILSGKPIRQNNSIFLCR